MNIISNIRLKYKLYRYTKDLNRFHDQKFRKNWLLNHCYGIFDICKRYKKHDTVRNLVAKLVKLVREENPFEPVDYSEAKKLYEDYFKIDNRIDYDTVLKKLLDDRNVYLTVIRNDIGVRDANKPERYDKCYLGEEIGTVFKAELKGVDIFEDDKTNEKVERHNISLKAPCEIEDGDSGIVSLDSYNFAHYRYSTPDEIEKFKSNLNKYNNLESEIRLLMQNVNDKREEQRAFTECVVKNNK